VTVEYDDLQSNMANK